MTDLDNLNSRLDLEAQLPQLLIDYPYEGDFWSAFAGLAEVIEDKADEQTYPHVIKRIKAMASAHGRLIAGVEIQQ